MTILTILRHAKSDWGDPALDDFDRPLNGRGRKAAHQVGRELKRRRIRFDRVLASPALRVRETLLGLADGYGAPFDIGFDAKLYGASEQQLLAIVRAIPNEVHAPLLVGHNPGLHELVLALSSDRDALRAEVKAKFPTAALAMVELPVVHWAEVQAGTGTIRELIFARDLD